MQNKKFTSEMTREELIDELRAQAHPSWFHRILAWDTERLRDLLRYYKSKHRIQ